MNFSFRDVDIAGFIFGQMTMTGYKQVVILECDYPEYGWKAGDMIVLSEGDHPCFRIEPLFGVGTECKDNPKVKTVRRCGAGIRLSDLPEGTQTPQI